MEHTSPPRTVRIAAFDFDHTLLEGSSPVLIVHRLVRRGVIPVTVALKVLWWGVRYKLHIQVEQKVVRQYIFRSLSHFPAESANQMMAELYLSELEQNLRPKGLAEMQHRREQGDLIVVVSASFVPIIEAFAQDNPIDGFVCTHMEIADGFYTGNVVGLPPEGEQKAVQLTAWADAHFGAGTWVVTWAYGDHYSDAPLLEMAENPVAVNPDTRLEKTAKTHGWQILDWSL